MKIATRFLLLLSLAALSACQKETVEPAETADFVPGELLVGLKDGVPITRAFRLADSLSFDIKQMSGFFYNSGLPKDSVAYVKRVLLSKPYLNKKGFTGDAVYFNTVDNKIRITDFFFDMDVASQQDWISTMQQLQLTSLNAAANMQLKVPIGSEKYWLTEVRKNSIVRWTELNGIGLIKLL